MRNIHAAEERQPAKSPIHRRGRGWGSPQKTFSQSDESTRIDQPLHLHDKQVVVIIE